MIAPLQSFDPRNPHKSTILQQLDSDSRFLDYNLSGLDLGLGSFISSKYLISAQLIYWKVHGGLVRTPLIVLKIQNETKQYRVRTQP